VFRFVTYFALSFLAAVSLLGSSPRAQYWKPIHRIGAQQLSIDEVRYLVLPDHSSKQFSAAIEDLQALYLQRYQRSLLMVKQARPSQAITFEISHAGEGGAFSIRRERSRVFVRGADGTALANAVYAICADLMGARWYWGGELGFEWAAPSMNHFPDRLWWERPAFVQRQLHPADTGFARRNRLNKVYSFNHNLAKVFTQELFEENPEVFAELNGRRKQPTGSGGTDPQPDFTNPEAVNIAAQAALAHFADQPNSTSFSLSINDNVLFDTSERTEAVVSPLRYFRGRPDYTDLVFGFMNRVAKRVFDEASAWQTPSGEDRYLTALSYYWTEPSPTIPIHPRVMPVLTSDRAQWHDPAYRAQDKKLIREWAASGAERVATWDYYFGAPYLHPRQFNQWIGESIQFLADAGVNVFFSQLPSFWGLDGAKAWLASELLWDSQQDVELLLEEYYQNFFGSAAESMRAFYELAERHRNENEGQAEWIKLYKDESGVALFTAEMLQSMRALLDEAGEVGGGHGLVNHQKAGLQLADTARYAARVEVVSRAFRLTELYADFDQSRRSLVDMCLDGADTSLIEDGLRIYRESMAMYYTYLENYLATSEYAPSRRHIDLRQSNPERLALAALVGESQAEFYSLAQDPKLNHRAYAERNFLGPLLPKLDGWNLDYRASEDFKVIASEWGAGDVGLRIENADMVSVFRTFPVVSTKEYQLRLRAAWQIGLDNRVHLHVAWLDRDGQTLESAVPLRLPDGQRETPVSIRLPLTAPNNAYDLRLRLVISRQYPGDYLDVSEIDFGLLR
jgi:hypothetical protein